ncbi:MAG: hypothetical protein ACO22R_10330, partial [Chitinophagaceae bacterium]
SNGDSYAKDDAYLIGNKISNLKDQGNLVNIVDEKIAAASVNEIDKKYIAPQISKLRERLDNSLNKVNSTLDNRINDSLSVVHANINQAIGNVFSQLKQQCDDESSKHSVLAERYSQEASAINVPPVQYEDCNCRRALKCIGLWKCECDSCPVPSSIKANADASAKKGELEGKAQSEEKLTKQYSQAASTVMMKKNEIDSSMDNIFSQSKIELPSSNYSGSEQEGDNKDNNGYSKNTVSENSVHPHGHSLINEENSVQRILRLSDSNFLLASNDLINASVGLNTAVTQKIGVLGGGAGTKDIANGKATEIVTAPVNAAIGYSSHARQVISSVGAKDGDQNLN